MLNPMAWRFPAEVGAGFEVGQLFGWVSGTFQWKDVGSNTLSVAAALAPMTLAFLRRARR